MPPKNSRGARGTRGLLGSRGGQSGKDGTSTDVSMQEYDSLSPASIPTETPASTSVARGRGRAGASVVGAGPPSFKPKAVRRDQSERQKAAEEDRRRVEERAREHELSMGRPSRGRGQVRGGQRLRGDAMGKRVITISTASGIFSSLPTYEKDKKSSGGIAQTPRESILGLSGYEGYSNAEAMETTGTPKSNLDSSSRVATARGGTSSGGVSGSTSSGVRVKREVADPVYPGLETQLQQGVNIEHINLVSDDENENEQHSLDSRKGKGRASGTSSGGLKPIRLLREEHQERVLVVNTEASSKLARLKESSADTDDDDGLFVPQDLEAERRCKNKPGLISRDATGKPWAGVWSDPEDDLVKVKAEVKAEPEEIYDVMDLGKPTPTGPANFPPHLKKEPVVPKEPLSPRLKPRIARASGMRDSEAALQTDEDKAEWQRHQEDVAILSHELGGLYNAGKLSNPADGDVEMDDGESEQTLDKEGRLYLFQFPPILPPLYNPDKIKKEDVMEDAEVSQMATKPAPEVSGSSAAPIDISNPANPTDVVIEGLKTEPDENAWKKNIQNAGDVIPEEGFIGKLIVRESGKVEMSWGSTSFELSRGAAHDFLMTTLLMDGLDDAAEGDDGGEKLKDAVGLGSVMGKFVVTPDWDKMFVD